MRSWIVFAAVIWLVAPTASAQASGVWAPGVDYEADGLDIWFDSTYDEWRVQLNVTLTNHNENDVTPNTYLYATFPEAVRNPQDNSLESSMSLRGGSWVLTPGETHRYEIWGIVPFQPVIHSLSIGVYTGCESASQWLGEAQQLVGDDSSTAAIFEELEMRYSRGFDFPFTYCSPFRGMPRCVDANLNSRWTADYELKPLELISDPNNPATDQYRFNPWIDAEGPGILLMWDKGSGSYKNIKRPMYEITQLDAPCGPEVYEAGTGPGWQVITSKSDTDWGYQAFQNGHCVSDQGIGYVVFMFESGEFDVGSLEPPASKPGTDCETHNRLAKEPVSSRLKDRLTPFPSSALIVVSLLAMAMFRRPE